jgi:hypothetical protein
MKKLSKAFVAVKGWFGKNTPQEISAQKEADLEEISEKFLAGYAEIRKNLSNKGYEIPPATLENINEVYINPFNQTLLSLETNRRYPSKRNIIVDIDFLPNAWPNTRFTRAINALQFNRVSLVPNNNVDNSILLSLNPKNFAITKTGEYTGPRQEIYEVDDGQQFPMRIVLVDAPHKWRPKSVAPSAPQSRSESVVEMEATLQ